MDQFPPVISLCSVFRSSWLSDHLLPSICPATICSSWLLTLNAPSHDHFLQTFSRASHDMSKMCQLVLHHRLEQATVVIEQGCIDNVMWKHRPSLSYMQLVLILLCLVTAAGLHLVRGMSVFLVNMLWGYFLELTKRRLLPCYMAVVFVVSRRLVVCVCGHVLRCAALFSQLWHSATSV